MTSMEADARHAVRSVRALKLQVKELRTSYGGVHALAGATLDVAEGEFLTLLGPSGSGKTTLLMAVAGLLPPDSGEIWIDGRLSTGLPAHHRNIGMVFQSYALFPHMSVRENIAFPLRMRGLSEAEIAQEVKRALDIVRLPDVGDRLPVQLSGGQQQRIALARCIVYRPPIVLMDEPMGALDKNLRNQLQLEIRRLHRELGTTIMYVTHDQEEALILSDRICLMNGGRIEQIGTPREMYFQPATAFAASFIGESNQWTAKIVGRNADSVRLQIDDGMHVTAPAYPREVPGDDVLLVVRPEHLRLLREGETAANVLKGILREVILAGQVTKYFVERSHGGTITVTSLSGLDKGTEAIGSAVRLGWSETNSVIVA